MRGGGVCPMWGKSGLHTGLKAATVAARAALPISTGQCVQ